MDANVAFDQYCAMTGISLAPDLNYSSKMLQMEALEVCTRCCSYIEHIMWTVIYTYLIVYSYDALISDISVAKMLFLIVYFCYFS